jgi:hypothetical protein
MKNLNEDINRMKSIMGIINEDVTEDKLTVSPFELWASSKGNVWIKNSSTGKQHAYKMEVYKGVMWIGIGVEDFPSGTHMLLSTPVGDKKIKVNKESLKKMLSTNFGSDELRQTDEDGNDIKFTKVT